MIPTSLILEELVSNSKSRYGNQTLVVEDASCRILYNGTPAHRRDSQMSGTSFYANFSLTKSRARTRTRLRSKRIVYVIISPLIIVS